MKPVDYLRRYLDEKHMMQLATTNNEQPWCCSVYYVHDNELNLYWASLRSRRHSKEIAENSKTAIAIAVKYINGEKVIGIQAQGSTELVLNSQEILPTAKTYAKKFGRDDAWVEDFSKLRTEHALYKFTPSLFVLFDEENFKDDPRQEIRL